MFWYHSLVITLQFVVRVWRFSSWNHGRYENDDENDDDDDDDDNDYDDDGMMEPGGLGLYAYKHHLDKKNGDTTKFWQELMELFTKWIRKGFLLYEEMQMVSHMSKPFITDYFLPFFLTVEGQKLLRKLQVLSDAGFDSTYINDI